MSKKTKIVGLTGGIGSGKSSILKLFKDKQIPVYEADIEAKRLMQQDESLKLKIKKEFGIESFVDEQLNTKFLAQLVFKNPELLKTLNAIVHPVVQKHFKKVVKTIEAPFIIYENAILFENGFDRFCDKIIAVTAPIDLRINRVMKRDGVSENQVIERMNNQWSDEQKIAKSDFVIENIHWDDTKKEVEKIYKLLILDEF